MAGGTSIAFWLFIFTFAISMKSKSQLSFDALPPLGFHCVSAEIMKHFVQSPFSLLHSFHSFFLHLVHVLLLLQKYPSPHAPFKTFLLILS